MMLREVSLHLHDLFAGGQNGEESYGDRLAYASSKHTWSPVSRVQRFCATVIHAYVCCASILACVFLTLYLRRQILSHQGKIRHEHVACIRIAAKVIRVNDLF